MKKLLLLLIILLFSTGFRGGCKKIFKKTKGNNTPHPIILKKTLEKKDSTRTLKNRGRPLPPIKWPIQK